MSKIAVMAKLTAAEGKGPELESVLSKMLTTVEGEDGTLVYALHRANDNADVYWFYELYADDAALATHSSSDAMKEMFGALGGLLAGGAELIVSTPVGGKGIDL
ncbi:MAG: putative quinol monooxygenase [Acidimicrobiales bacterium]